MVRASLLAAAALCLTTSAQPVAKCVTCHSAEARSQPHTPMGIGLQLPAGQSVLNQHPGLTFQANGYKYVIEHKDGANVYTVSDGANSLALPIRYAFGVSSQTFVLEHRGHFYESLVSYYPSAGGLAITMGSERVRPRTLVEAMGREAPEDEIVACFGCHSSGGVIQGKLALATMKPGLDCEHCHAGSTAHMESPSQDKVPKKLGAMSAEDTSTFCGGCHRTWDAVVRMKVWGELNVRFQPYRLANSKCFLGNDKRISCTGCHNPHADLVRVDTAYDRNCVACHTAPQKTCPVAAAKCVTCHMPKVELPGSHSVFTDHQIRIVRPGGRYPN